jgi:hypothetical protein
MLFQTMVAIIGTVLVCAAAIKLHSGAIMFGLVPVLLMVAITGTEYPNPTPEEL